ncbi:MAG: hypothetical protein ACR2L2_18805 [Acidobacteriota bacterium]
MPSVVAQTVEMSSAALQDYVGEYGNREISVRDGGLRYQRIGGGGAVLRAIGQDKFVLNRDAQITFMRDAKGVVSEMLVEWVDRDKEQLKRAMPTSNQANTKPQNERPLSQAEQPYTVASF